MERAVGVVVEQLEERALFTADPFANQSVVQTLPYVLDFTQDAGGLLDKDGAGIGLTRVQTNKNGDNASYNASLLDLTTSGAGTLKVTTTGTSSAGSNFNGDNTLVNGLETQFDATTSGFQITVRIIGPLTYLTAASQQAGIYFGPDQDNYLKFVISARDEGPRLQFTDEQTYSGVFTHSVNLLKSIGSMSNVQTLDLRLTGDAGNGTVRASYSVNGASFLNMSSPVTLRGDKRDAFFTTSARAGIITLQKNNLAPVTATYDKFEIQPGLTLAGRPSVVATRPSDTTTNVDRNAFIAADLDLPNGGIDNSTLNGNTVKLYRNDDHSIVPSVVNTSGGGDTIVLQPTTLLDADTGYTFEVTDGVTDTAGAPFVSFTMSFTTGEGGADTDSSLSFEKIALPQTAGIAFTGLKIGPDGKLYASSADGNIYRFPVNEDGTLGTAQVITSINDLNQSTRFITGFTFDPASTADNLIMYVSNSFNSIVDSPDWQGKITKLTGPDLATAQDLIVGLPRSARDHMTNQPTFGPDGALYFAQASNSAMGAADTAWGNRNEHLLNASMLRIDLSKLTPGVPLDVKTEDGGTYDPFAANAPLTIYAEGIRNAYDMIWTSDGELYASINGSASGGNTPAGGGAPALTNVAQTQNDYLLHIEPGGYYGHPNPTQGHYVLNGGNPTQSVDPQEVPEYPVGTLPDPDYRGIAYDFGKNASPDGGLEYQNTSVFGGALAGKLLIVRYSGGDDIIVLTRDDAGNITQAQTGIAGMRGFADPLDIVENPTNGYLYVAEYSESDPTLRKITLVRPVPLGAHITTDKTQLVFNDISSGSTGGTGSSKVEHVTITNTGTAPLTFPANGFSIIDDPDASGNDVARFSVTNLSSLPETVAVGESFEVDIAFTANAVGVKSAFLQVSSNDPSGVPIKIALRGVGTSGTGGTNEPSLARILRAYQIPTIVGDGPNDSDDASTDYPTPADASSEEVPASQLLKAGAGNVTIELLASMAKAKNSVSSSMGFYTPGNEDDRTELFALDAANAQTLDPEINAGGKLAFDPGAAAFSLYGIFPNFQDATKDAGLPRVVYSEDSLNAWDTSSPHKVRFFPLKDADGTVVPNAYIFAFEEFDASFDSNDLVGIIRNVTIPDPGPEIGFENVDSGAFTSRLVMNKIQNTDNSADGKPNNLLHDTATLLVRNTGTDTLVITSMAVSGQFTLLNPPAANTAIAPGASISVQVQFTSTTGDIKEGTLTINSTDADEPVSKIDLEGFWQSVSENNQEPKLSEIFSVMGYGTTVSFDGQHLTDGGKIERVGDEVLSPYWNRADDSAPVTVTQLASFHTEGSSADLYDYAQGSPNGATRLFTSSGDYGQSFFPLRDNNTSATFAKFNPTSTFGWRIAGHEYSDPALNVPVDGLPNDEGHHVRFWVARNPDGSIIPNTYLMSMDYSGINYDYNDNVYLITNVAPTSPPSAPTTLTATSSGSLQLNWDDNTEANLAGYNVYRSDAVDGTFTKLNASLLTSSSFNDVFAPVGQSSFYRVTAVDTTGNESTPAAVSGIRTGDTVPPVRPIGFSATGGDAGIALNWVGNAESDLAGYQLYRSDSATGTFTALSDALLTSTQFLDAAAPRGATSFYQLVAVDTAGNASPFAATSAARPSGPATPDAPTGLSAQTVSFSAIDLSWTATDGATSYTLERRVSGALTWSTVTDDATATTYSDTGLLASTDYEYRVSARNEAGLSDPSDSAIATTDDAPILPAASITDASVTEPSSGSTAATFTVTLDKASDSAITILYSTADGTAVAGSDYTAATGSIVFAPGETSKTIDVAVLHDAEVESTETFTMNLTVSSGNATLADAHAVGSIADLPGTVIPIIGKKPITFTGSNDKPVKVTLSGPGTASVTVLSDGVATITATGTTAASSLTVTGTASLAAVNVTGSLKSFTGKTIDLAGDVSISGSVGKLTAKNASGGHAITLGGGGGADTSIVLGTVSDLSLTSASAIKSLSAAGWSNTDSTADVISAPSVGAVSIKGNFSANLITSSLKSLTVSGAMSDNEVRISGAAGAIKAGALNGALIFAGVSDSLNGLPTASGDLGAGGSIKSITVSGRAAGAFSDTSIGAATIGKVSLGAINTSNAGVEFGLAAHDIASVAGTAGADKLKLKKLTTPGQSTANGDFKVRLL